MPHVHAQTATTERKPAVVTDPPEKKATTTKDDAALPPVGGERGASVSSAGDVKLDASSWAAIVRANFDAWDKNGDGALGVDELKEHVKSGKWHGAELSALYTAFVFATAVGNLDPSKGQTGAIAREDLAAFEKSFPAFPPESELSVVQRFHEYHTGKLASADAGLFGADGTPDWKMVEQNGTNTCTFLSAIISRAAQDPEAIKKIITLEGETEKNGVKCWQFKVVLAGKAQSVTLSELDILEYSTAGSDGLWIPALEAAVGAKFGIKNGIYTGGKPKRGVKRLEGGAPKSIDLKDKHRDKAREAMLAAFREGRILTAGIYDAPESADLSTEHAYAVIAFDGATVQVRCPHGGRLADLTKAPVAENDGADGVKNLGDGLLEMDFETFCKNFDNIAIGR